MLDGVEKARVAGAQARAPQHIRIAGCGNFGAPRRPPLTASKHAADLPRRRIELARADRHLARGPRLLRELRQKRARFCSILPGSSRNSRATSRSTSTKAGRPKRLSFGKYVPPHTGSPVGREKHGHRPAALLAQQMQRAHVDLVDVGTLLAVDLDVDEQLVHHPRRRLVLEALVRHDVAPVTGGVADRKQDRLAGFFRFIKRLRPPLPPVHRIVLVLEQIRRCRAGKAIAVRGLGRRHGCSLTRIQAGHDFRPGTASPPPVPFEADAGTVGDLHRAVFHRKRLEQNGIRPLLPFQPVRGFGDAQRVRGDFRIKMRRTSEFRRRRQFPPRAASR